MTQNPTDVSCKPPFAENTHDRTYQIAWPIITASIIGSVILSRYASRRLLFSRTAMIGIAAELVVLAVLKRRQVWRTVKEFFIARTHPVNLAIFRMVVFWAIFREVQLPTILSFSRMPSGLQFAPWGMGALLPHLLIDSKSANVAGILLLIFSATAFIGLFSRTSALACTLLGFYALGIPNFYGKVDHNQHLIWFAAILAVSPCGDFLAFDAVLDAWKRKDEEGADPFPSSLAYALPLRFVMLLIGVIYFFPGFWKLWQNGFDWFLTDNLPRQLHLFWLWSFDGLWLPVFRVDQHLLLCRVAAAATVLFELTFIFLMFSRKLRIFPAFAGLVFHGTTNWLMRISFLSLRVCYVALFDWAPIFAAIGRVLYTEELLLVYDGTSLSARRFVGFIRVWDVFGRVVYADAANKERLGTDFPGERIGDVRNQRLNGFSGLWALSRRVPLLWPAVPALYFWLSAEKVYIAYQQPDTQSVQIDPTVPMMVHRPVQLTCIAVVGCMLLVGNISGGISRRINGWPFACYPTFSLPPGEQTEALDVIAVGPSGREQAVRDFGFSYHRFYGLSMNILNIEDSTTRNDRLVRLWARAIQTTPALRTTVAVKFYVESLWIDPDRWSRNPQEKGLLFVWHPAPDGSMPLTQTDLHLSFMEWQ